MGKGTFYVYFKNKKELLMECIDRLTVTMVPREAWAQIRGEQDFDRKTRKRGLAFLDAFPGFRGILNMLRIALGGSDPALAEKAKEAFRILSAPMAKDLRRGISEGVVRPDVDVELFAFLQLSLAEGFGYWLMMESQYSVEEGMDTLIDIFGNGLTQKTDKKPKAPVCRTGPGELRDSRGVTTRLEEILMGEEPCLPGKVGEAQVELDLANTRGVEFSQQGADWIATATLKDGSKVVLHVDGETNVSGQASFGAFHIPLKSIAGISFEQP